MIAPRLRLHHELLLLALHDDKGTVAFGQMQDIGLAGALFAELLLEDRLRIVSEKRRFGVKEFVEVADAARFGEGVLDAGLRKLSEAKRRASPRDTVMRLTRLKGLRHDVARELVRKGVLRATEEQVLLFFRRRAYPTLDPGPERALVERIRGALDAGDADPTGRTILLVALAQATGVLRALYGRKELKAIKARVEELSARAGAGGDATTAAVRAAQAAAVAATSAAVTAATAAASG